MCTLWEKLGVRTTSEIIHVQQRQTHTSETDFVEGGGVRSEGVRVRVFGFLCEELEKKSTSEVRQKYVIEGAKLGFGHVL